MKGKKSINFLNTFDYNFYRHFDLTNAGFCGMIINCITHIILKISVFLERET